MNNSSFTSGWLNRTQLFFLQVTNHPFLTVIGLMSTLIIFGVGGYMVIEGWSFSDALYMTVITLSTIGYGEINPLSQQGRIFTIILITVGVIVATYAVTATIELFTSQEFLYAIRERRRRRVLSDIYNHTIICGFGRLGRSLAKEMTMHNAPVIIIDVDPEVGAKSQQLGYPSVIGSGSDENILAEARIEQARALVAAANSDAENVFITLTARSINPKLQIITRSNRDSSIAKLEKAGADLVISPFNITGQRIANMIIRPNVVDFLDGVLEFGDHRMRIEELIINEDSPIAGKTLKEAKLKVAVLALDHPGEMVFTHPTADTVLLPGTAIIVMGVDEELRKVIAKVAS